MNAFYRLVVVLLLVGGAVLAGSTLTSIPDANAGVRKTAPTIFNLLASTPDSLFVELAWTPGTVTSPTEAVLSNVDWFRNSALVDSLRLATQTRDTIRIGRAPFGGTDTISVSLVSSYQGRFGPAATAMAVYDNPDTQIPGSPIIITLDSLPGTPAP